MRSAVDIAAESLAEILPVLQLAAKVIGSQPAPAHVVRLVIEGAAIPDAPKVDCTFTKLTEEGEVSFQIEFKPLPDGALSDVEMMHGEGVGVPSGISSIA